MVFLMNQSLDVLISEASKLNYNLNSELRNKIVYLESRLMLNSLFSDLINEVVNFDYEQAINLVHNLELILSSDYLTLINNCKLIGVEARISDDELINYRFSKQSIDLFIKSVYNSPEYKNGFNNFREQFVNKINNLLSKISDYYHYLPSLTDWKKESLKKSFHPKWLTNDKLVNNIDELLKSNDLLLINKLGNKVLNYLSNVLVIVENWDYCDDEGCNNFSNFIETSGGKVCGVCGGVLGKNFVSIERRAYSIDEINDRKMNEPKHNPFGPRTDCSDSRDFNGNLFTPRRKGRFHRLSKIQRSVFNNYERSLLYSSPKFKQLNSEFNGKDYLYRTALRIYSEVAKRKLTMGRSIDQFIAASYYASLKINKEPILLFDLIDKLSIINDSVTQREVLTAYQIIKNEGIFKKLGYNPNQIKLLDYANHYFNRVNIVGGLREEMIDLINKLDGKREIMGKDPAGLIAAIIYKIVHNKRGSEIDTLRENIIKHTSKNYSNNRITQEMLADYLHVTSVTVRSRLKQLESLNY